MLSLVDCGFGQFMGNLSFDDRGTYIVVCCNDFLFLDGNEMLQFHILLCFNFVNFLWHLGGI